jgi:hypothetical protein
MPPVHTASYPRLLFHTSSFTRPDSPSRTRIILASPFCPLPPGGAETSGVNWSPILIAIVPVRSSSGAFFVAR